MSAGGSTKVVVTAMCSNLGVALVKLAAAVLTGSGAMMSEAIHTFVDTGNQILMLIGIRRSQIPPSEQYPFGHHRELYFWGFIVASVLFLGGGVLTTYNGVQHLLHPDAPEHLRIMGHEVYEPLFNSIILVIGGLMEFGSLRSAWKEFTDDAEGLNPFRAFRECTNASTLVVLVEDIGAMVGLGIALLSQALIALTGWWWIDGTASLMIGIMLLVASYALVREMFGLNIGENSDPELARDIRAVVAAHPGVLFINELLVEHRGPDSVLVLISIDGRDSATIGDGEKLVTRLEREIKDKFEEVNRVFIEFQSKEDSRESIIELMDEYRHADEPHSEAV